MARKGQGEVRGYVVHQDRRIERVRVEIDYPNLWGTPDGDGRVRVWQYTGDLRVLANGRPYVLLANHTIEPVALPGQPQYRQSFERSSHAIRKRFSEILGGAMRKDPTRQLLMLSLAIGLVGVALVLMVFIYVTPDALKRVQEIF